MTSTKVSQIVTVDDSDCEVGAAVDNVEAWGYEHKAEAEAPGTVHGRSMSLCFAASAWWFWMTHTVLSACKK